MDFLIASTIIAGIVALVKGSVDAIDSAQDDKKAREKIDDEQDYLEATYNNSLDQAEEQFNTAKDNEEKNKEEAYRKADVTDLQADLSDKGLNISERSLSSDFNTAIDNLYLSQASDLMSYQNAAMQAGSSTGSALASLSASGVRSGSSLSDAVLMQSAVNSEQLQFSQDAQRRSQNNDLGSVLNQIAGNRFGIMQNRIGADLSRADARALRANADYRYNSYFEGGHNYNLYKMETTGLSDDQPGRLKLSYDFNKEQLKKEREQVSGANSFWKGVGAFFGGGASGFKSGYDISTTIYKGINYGG